MFSQRIICVNQLYSGLVVQKICPGIVVFFHGQIESGPLQDTAKHSVGGKTFERYGEIVERHLIPALGKHPLAKLHATHIQAYYSKARISGRLNGKGGLSEKTLAQYHRILRESLQDALRLQLINKNPADSVIAPKPKHREMNTLNTEQIAQLLEIVKEKNQCIPILLALHTGMRRGEVFGLRWKDVDLDKGTLSVRQSAEVTRSGGIQFKKPKTQKSRRMISLMPSTVEELRKLKTRQKEERISAGPAYKDSSLVCRKEDGSPMNPDVFSKSFAMMIKKTDLPRFDSTICDIPMRHSCSTSMNIRRL